jgi:hypothetical protein
MPERQATLHPQSMNDHLHDSKSSHRDDKRMKASRHGQKEDVTAHPRTMKHAHDEEETDNNEASHDDGDTEREPKVVPVPDGPEASGAPEPVEVAPTPVPSEATTQSAPHEPLSPESTSVPAGGLKHHASDLVEEDISKPAMSGRNISLTQPIDGLLLHLPGRVFVRYCLPNTNRSTPFAATATLLGSPDIVKLIVWENVRLRRNLDVLNVSLSRPLTPSFLSSGTSSSSLLIDICLYHKHALRYVKRVVVVQYSLQCIPHV